MLSKVTLRINALTLLFGRFQVLFVVIWPIVSIFNLKSSFTLSSFARLHLYFFIVSFLSFITVVGSIGYDQSLIYPVKCLFGILLVVVGAVFFQNNKGHYSDYVNFLTKSSLLLFFLSITNVTPFDQQWIGGAFNGFFANRNGCAFFYTLLAVYHLGKYLDHSISKSLWCFVLLSLIVLLTFSRLGFGLITLAFLYLFYVKILRNPFFYIPAISTFFSVVVLLFNDFIEQLGVVSQIILLLSGEGHNVAERQSVYGFSLELLGNFRFFGYGFYRFGDLSPFLKTHAHNIFLQGFVDLGFLFIPVFFAYSILTLKSVFDLIMLRSVSKSLVFLSYMAFSLLTLPIATPTSALILGLLYRKEIKHHD